MPPSSANRHQPPPRMPLSFTHARLPVLTSYAPSPVRFLRTMGTARSIAEVATLGHTAIMVARVSSTCIKLAPPGVNEIRCRSTRFARALVVVRATRNDPASRHTATSKSVANVKELMAFIELKKARYLPSAQIARKSFLLFDFDLLKTYNELFFR